MATRFYFIKALGKSFAFTKVRKIDALRKHRLQRFCFAESMGKNFAKVWRANQIVLRLKTKFSSCLLNH
jgi:hypothetical protein